MKYRSRIAYLALVTVLLALLANLLTWLHRMHGQHHALETASKAAALLAPETPALLHVPDLQQARERLASANFAQLGVHQGLRHLLSQLLQEFPELHFWEPWLRRGAALPLSELTVAQLPGEPQSGVVVLFQTTAAEDGRALWNSLIDFWPPMEETETRARQTTTHRGVEIQQVASPTHCLEYATWDGWHGISNRRGALEETLARWHGLQSQKPLPSLLTETRFAQSLTSLKSRYLSLTYLAAEPGADADPAQPSLPLTESLSHFDWNNAAQTLTVANGQLVEELVALTGSPQSAGTPAAAAPSTSFELTRSLTSPNTLFFVTSHLASPSMRNHLLRPFHQRWAGSEDATVARIAEQWHDAFLPHWSLQLEPVEHLDAAAEDHQPVATLAAFALKPEHHLQAALETLADTRGSGIARSQTGTFQLRQALLPHPLRHWVKAVHLQVRDDFLVLSDDARGLHQVLRKGKGTPTLEQHREFRRLRKRLPAPQAGLAFLNAHVLLSRGKEALQHPLVFATLWMGIHSQTNLDIDLKTLARSLRMDLPVLPTVATWQQTDHGIHMSSRGTLSPSQWALAGGVILKAIDSTFLEAATLTENSDSFTPPPIEQELLRMMEPEAPLPDAPSK